MLWRLLLREDEPSEVEVTVPARHRHRRPGVRTQSASRFEEDRRRDARLSARGLQVVRVTWRQIVREPEAMLTRLAQILTGRAAGNAG